jgi:hypothetical protein
LQDVFPVPCVAHLTPKAPSRPVPVDTLKPSRVLTLVIVLQLSEHLVETYQSFMGKNIGRCVPVHNLICALFDAINVGWRAVAVLPVYAADITELCATFASWKSSAVFSTLNVQLLTSYGCSRSEAERHDRMRGRSAILNSAPTPASDEWKGHPGSHCRDDIHSYRPSNFPCHSWNTWLADSLHRCCLGQ